MPIVRRCLAAVLLVIASSVPALAQNDDNDCVPGATECFIDMGRLVVDGHLMRPEGWLTRSRQRAVFPHLLELERELLDKVAESAQEPALE